MIGGVAMSACGGRVDGVMGVTDGQSPNDLVADAMAPDLDSALDDSTGDTVEASTIDGAPLEAQDGPMAVFPVDASLATPCASGPTVLYVDSTGDAGGSWPVIISDNQATWDAPVTSGVFMQLNVVPVGGLGQGGMLALNGIPETALAPGHYSLPAPAGGINLTFQVADAICEMPSGSLDIYAFEDTGGDQASLTALLADFDVTCGGATYTGCINYSATPSVPPTVPAADPEDPTTACGGSARDVIRVNDHYETNLDALVSVSSTSANDLQVMGWALGLEFTVPDGVNLDVATYGPGAPPGAPAPYISVAIDGDVQCDGPAASFALYDWQAGSLVLGYDCMSGGMHWRGCVRYEE